MNEAASHAASRERRYDTLEQEARSLFGKQADAIQAHLVGDALQHITPQDDGQRTHHTWVSTFAMTHAISLLVWAFTRIDQLEREAAGQQNLFACEIDEGDQ